MAQRMDVRVGMVVKSRDGHQMGRVIGLLEDAFVVEKGVLYARDYRVPFRAVERIEDEDIHLVLDKDQMHKASLGEVLEASIGNGLTLGPQALSEARMNITSFQDRDASDVRSEAEKDEEAAHHP
ncbi:hypothetical protein CYFUS_000563 [Cystobacter fuscus]|uniref:PRC-barrel domain-containing protein n=1 Tax=Cystobacter fuscus TaxID=43 RepID=A0A250IVF8_9BACT|nr:hypothetical protein [Cystobacter fuscus]ATB35151.1 hypothetical protein CYFUS_000563 [Cystobacter fuscus]